MKSLNRTFRKASPLGWCKHLFLLFIGACSCNFELQAQDSQDTVEIFRIEEFVVYRIKCVYTQVEDYELHPPNSRVPRKSTAYNNDIYRAGKSVGRVAHFDSSECKIEFHDRRLTPNETIDKIAFIVIDLCTKKLAREFPQYNRVAMHEVDSIFMVPIDSVYRWNNQIITIPDFYTVKPVKLDSLRKRQVSSYFENVPPLIKDKKEYAPVTGRFRVVLYTKKGKYTYIMYHNNALINGWRYGAAFAYDRNFAQEVWDAMNSKQH